jgi:hypothetical protein
LTSEHQRTREQEAYEQYLEEKKQVLSGPARTILREAKATAYAANMVHSYSFQPEEYEEAMDRMRLAAVDITSHDCELLAKLWRAALAAAASIAPDQTPAPGHKLTREDVH